MKSLVIVAAVLGTLFMVGSAEATNRSRVRSRSVQRNVQRVEKVQVERVVVKEVQPIRVEKVRVIERQINNHCDY